MLYRQPKEKKQKKDTFYIFINGETEELYFSLIRDDLELKEIYKKFSIKFINVSSALQLVTEVKNSFSSLIESKKVWCVFDIDSGHNTVDDLKEAFRLADKHGINIGFSNMAIEYWFLSHYRYFTQPMNNSELEKEMNQLYHHKLRLNKDYKKQIKILYNRFS